MDTYLTGQVANGFSGSALISRGGQVLLHRGYGSLAGVTMQPSSRYWVASITKQFTAAALLKLREQGRLSLSDPLRRFFPDAPADKAGITIEQLLTHRSGLPQDYVADGITDRAAAVRAIFAQPLGQAPGERFVYSNDNFQLAGAIVETLTGGGIEEFVQSQLLRPAGLLHTGFWATDGAREATPLLQAIAANISGRNWGLLGSGGMYSTAEDLHTWYRALKAGTVLSRESVEDLFRARPASPTLSVGLGWFTSPTARGSTSLWTRGNEEFGPNALIYVYPEDDTVVILLSHAGENAAGIPWTRALREGVEAILYSQRQGG